MAGLSNMYFIGVTTRQSAMRGLFPRWCEIAGRPGVHLIGVDLPVGTVPEVYRDTLQRIRDDEESYGALITTHKVALFEHGADFFTRFDEDAAMLGEVGCIVRRNGALSGAALDYECSGGALARIVPPAEMKGRTLLIFGAGGAGTALAAWVAQHFPGMPIAATDRSMARLAKARAVSGAETILVGGPEDNDAVLRRVPEGTIVVNATGLGKDLPGSPISDDAVFPKEAVAWELNYRGDLVFQRQAQRFPIRVADGWDYFLRGWSTTMSRVLDFPLTPELFERLRDVAESGRKVRLQS